MNTRPEEHAEEEEAARKAEDIGLYVSAGAGGEIAHVAASGCGEVEAAVALAPKRLVERILLFVAELREVVAALPVVDGGLCRKTYLIEG